MSRRETVKSQADVHPSGLARADDVFSDPVAENLALIRRFVAALVDDPSITDGIPEGASVVLLPDDDPELADAHRRWGEAMMAAGKTVRFIGLPPRPAGDG